MFPQTAISYVKDFNCHIGTTICFWLFGFPGTDSVRAWVAVCRKAPSAAPSRCLPNRARLRGWRARDGQKDAARRLQHGPSLPGAGTPRARAFGGGEWDGNSSGMMLVMWFFSLRMVAG